ncbi:MAG TPA: GMC family oxidoreductase [Gemmatimonadales bacterium]|nr:GMC family oxidoreductase [Gemmatimonadales bacterium]
MSWDAIVVGSGFGAAFAARPLVEAGLRVLLLERGRRVTRSPESWAPHEAAQLSQHYNTEPGWMVEDGHGRSTTGGFFCLGGPSVFYGGVSLRFRAEDFHPPAEIVGDSGAAWPWDYAELEPWYAEVERALGVAGEAGVDPTEPPRSTNYVAAPKPLAPISAKLTDAARALGYHPFRLPLALNYSTSTDETDRSKDEADGRGVCIECGTCDGFACAISAKNDVATVVLPALVAQGLEVRTGHAVTRILADDTRVTGVESVDVATGTREVHQARAVILAAGTLATPQILFNSQLSTRNSAQSAVGAYLTRHINRIVFGLFAKRPDPENRHHKQVGIHDLYFPVGSGKWEVGRIGGLQSLVTPPVSLVRAQVPKFVGPIAARLVPHLTGLLAIAEDQPQAQNRISVIPGKHDALGLPTILIRHQYTERDERAVGILADAGQRILRKAGALAFYRHRIWTFSHALGTVRMGIDPRTAPLDGAGCYRGVENLVITDGSALPTSASVNPSLTIAATALRAGTLLAQRLTRVAAVSSTTT